MPSNVFLPDIDDISYIYECSRVIQLINSSEENISTFFKNIPFLKNVEIFFQYCFS